MIIVSPDGIAKGLKQIFTGISDLNTAFPHRKFTIDGRLVGDIGEVIAAHHFDIILDGTEGSKYAKSRKDFDAVTRIGGADVQIKATFQDALTFKKGEGRFLGLKFHQDGNFEVIFNGPAKEIYDKYAHRKGIGKKLLRFPNKNLKEFNKKVLECDRIPER